MEKSTLTGLPVRLFVLAFSLLGIVAKGDIAADFASITGTAGGQTVTNIYYPYTLVSYGKAAFPILRDVATDPVVVMAAGRYNDSYETTAARAVVFGSSNFVTQSSPAAPLNSLLENSAKWTAKKTSAGLIKVGCGSGVPTSFWTSLGFVTKSVTTSMSSSSNDLSTCDIFVFNINSNYSASAITKIRAFTASGGGLIVAGWPYDWNAQQIADMSAVLAPFGIYYSKDTWTYDGSDSAVVPSTPFSAYYSARTAAGDLAKDKEGTITMSAADKTLAAASIDEAVALGSRLLSGFNVTLDLSGLNADLDALSDASRYGIIAPTKSTPLSTTAKPVEAMLARYQSAKFDAMTPAELFVHPCAADFPGLPNGGTPTSKTISINGNTPANNLNNNGQRPIRFETGTYAAPGATITVTIPASKITNGLQVHIAGNGSEDSTWNQTTWTFFPKLWRRVNLTSATIQTGSVFGGLVTILVPPGSSLGTFDVTVSGVLEAPTFVLGQNTDAEWNSTLKYRPAPYGFVQTDKITLYVPKSQLALMNNPTAVATHWKTVMDTADEYYGYTAWRKRGEGIASSRYVSAGGAYATYPIEAGWGTDSDEFLDNVRWNGHWGNYHELGHGFQNNFDDAFVIPTHAEVDVNLFPAMMYSMVHDRTSWEYFSSFYGASDRTTKRAGFLARPSAEQTWANACDTGDGPAYDFYYNLSDAFGWSAYKTAFTRLMNHIQNPTASTDTELKLTALNSSDPNYKRNRFYVLFCEATGRNLDTYFQRYGLGVTGKGYEITASVKTLIAGKGYPVWTDNTDIDSLSNPGTLSVAETTAPGTEIYQFTAVDADEPGTVWTYDITAGNTNNAFSIDKRTGKLRAVALDAETTASYNLTVRVQDNGVPRFAKTTTFTVNVTNVAEAPRVAGKLFTATSAMTNGTSLGSVTATVESGRTIANYAILSGNDGHFTLNSTTGSLTISNASTLPNPGAYVLKVRVTDSTSATGTAYVTVLCNSTGGVYEERWNNQTMSGAAAVTGIRTPFNAPTNAADAFSRRMSGWVIPPTTGLYTFWIAADDIAQLSLSTDSSAANKSVIASVVDATSAQVWTTSASQQSQSVLLEAGRPYYIEATHIDFSSSDHVAVAWSGPGIAQALIPGANLVPNVPGVTAAPVSLPPSVVVTAPANGSKAGVPGTVTLTATVTDNFNTIDKVQFYEGASLIGEDASAPYSYGWLSPSVGTHTISAKAYYADGTVDSPAVAFTAKAFPVAANDSVNAVFNTALTISVLANDSGAADSTLSIQSVTQGAHGTVTISGTQVVYTPANGWLGSDTFTYTATSTLGGTDTATVTVLTKPANVAPVFASNPLIKTNAVEGLACTGTLADSATDANAGDTLTFSKISGNAWLSIAADGSISGTPLTANAGVNNFTIRVTDQDGLYVETVLRITVVLANGVWSNVAGGSWSDAANWTDGVIANGTNNTASFSTLNPTANATVYLDGSRTIGNLTFADTTPSHNWILNTGSYGPLTLDVSSGTPTITVTNQTATINAVLTGTDGLTKAGAGTLVLAGPNTYTGVTTVNAGTLVIADNTELNSGSGVTVAAAGTLQLNTGASATYPSSAITVNGAGTSATTGLYLAGGITHSAQGKINLQTAPTTVRTVGGGSVQISGYDINSTMIVTASAASGSVFVPAINFGGAGYGMNFSTTSGSANATGDLTVGGNLLNSGTDGFGVYFNGTGSVLLTGASPDFTNPLRNRLTINSTGTVIFGGASTFGGGNFNGLIIFGGTGKLKYDRTAPAQTFSGVISGAGGLTKSNTGTLTLSAANTYTGTTTISGGILNITGSLAAGAVTVQSGGTLGGSGTIGGTVAVQSGGAIAPGSGAAGTLTLSSKTLSLAGTAKMEIGKSGAVLSADKVAGITTLTYGGTLEVTDVGADDFAAGDSFQLFGATGYNGNFSTISLPALPAGLVWKTTRLSVDGTIFVRSLPVAVDDSTTTAEDTAKTFAVMTNDTEGDGDTLSIQSVTQGGHGTVTISGTNVIYTPAANWFGSDSFTYTITDSGDGTSTATVSIVVTPVNDPPTFTTSTIAGAAATEDLAYTGSIASYGADVDTGDTLAFSKVSGPAWLSVAANGALSGTPLNGDVGANAFVVKVTDAGGLNVNATLNISVTNVNDAPTFTSNPITGAGATEDVAYSGSIASYGADVDVGDTRTFSKVSGPAWLVVASNGSLSGTPLNVDVGANSFVVKVQDTGGLNATATLNITVTNVNDVPTFTSNPITGGVATEDVAYAESIAGYGADVDAGDTRTYSKVSGPAWLGVASNGALSGTPLNADVGANVFTVRVTDAANATADATLNITVTNVNDAPTFTANPITGPTATEDSSYSGSIVSYAADVDVGETLTYSKVSGPVWLVVAANGALSGTPLNADVGPNSFEVKVQDAAGLNVTATLNITVTNVNDAPTFTVNPITGAGATAGTAYTGSVASYGADIDAGEVLTFSKTAGPAWLNVAANGSLSGTPAVGDVGSAAFTIKVADVAGANASATLNIPVAAPPNNYASWATTLTPTNTAMGADPDHDGMNNLGEFAFDSNPSSPLPNKKIVTKPMTMSGQDYLVITVPVRNGANFGGSFAKTSGTPDGIIYNIEGTVDFQNWSAPVTEVIGTPATELQNDMPQLDEGWSYHTFRTPRTGPKVFLRARATASP